MRLGPKSTGHASSRHCGMGRITGGCGWPSGPGATIQLYCWPAGHISVCRSRGGRRPRSWRVYSSMVVDGRAAWGRGRPAASALPFIWERVIVLKAGLELGAGALAIHVAPSPCMPCSPVSGTVAHPLAVACAPATLTCLCCSADGIGRVVVRNKDKCAGARCEGLWRRHASWWACPRQALIIQRALIQHRAAHR